MSDGQRADPCKYGVSGSGVVASWNGLGTHQANAWTAVRLRRSVERIALQPRLAHSHAAGAAYSAPLTIPARIAKGRWIGLGSETFSATIETNMPPKMIWPGKPTWNRPARKAMIHPSATIVTGTSCVSVPPSFT